IFPRPCCEPQKTALSHRGGVKSTYILHESSSRRMHGVIRKYGSDDHVYIRQGLSRHQAHRRFPVELSDCLWEEPEADDAFPEMRFPSVGRVVAAVSVAPI